MKKYVYYVSYFCTNGIGYAISTFSKKLNDFSCEELEYYINELAHDSKNKKVVPISFTFLREENMITKEQMKAAGFSPIVYGKYDGRGWTKTLHDKEVVVELYYTPENGFAIDVSIDDDFVETDVCTIPLTEIMFPLMKADISIYDSVELP